jgi:DNA replication protein DnaC
MMKSENLIFECNECNDTEFIFNSETNTATECKCRQQKYYQRILENSGVAKAFRSKTINEYKVKNDQQKQAKQVCIEYITNFNTIKQEKNNSVAFLGQVGAGKTHLTIAVANALLKQGIGVVYMQYVEEMTRLKMNVTDEEMYQRAINRLKKCPLLIIDDLYKEMLKNGKVNASDVRIMFEIINFRYMNKFPILVSAEDNIDKLIDIDEAVGTRIGEMCKYRTIEFKGKELNHRMT